MKSNKDPVDSSDRRRARTDLAGNYIVEAAAGTGKTTLLVGRILNLIIDKKASPENIVAITFTERAAAELKMRLQDEISKALKAAIENAGKTKTEKARHLAEALRSFERMQVATIHSFCAALLRERPVEAGIDPNFEVADELRSSLIADETWEDWIAREMDGDDPVLREAVMLSVTLENMSSLARTMTANRDMLEHLPEPVDLEKTLKEITVEFRTTVEVLESLRKNHCRKADDKAALAILPLIDIVATLGKAEKEGALSSLFLDGTGLSWRKNSGAKGNWESAEILDQVRSKMETLKDLEKRAVSAIHHNAIARLAGKLSGYVEAYEKAKDAEEALDFQDLLIYTRDMLAGHQDVRGYFSRRYKYILVDEFQDTDPLQAEIIFLLSEKEPGKADSWIEAEPEPGKVFLVGDPKQSIYRFRRADIEMYAEAKRKLGRERLLNIHQNFRCAPSIVDAVNTIFGDLIRPSTDGNYQPEYVPLHFGRGNDTVPRRHGMVLLHPPPEIVPGLTKARTRRIYEARAIASFIGNIIDEKWQVYDKQEDRIRPVELRDIAVLMETHSPLPALEEAMRLYEIDYRVIGGKYFYFRQEVQQLVAVLRAIENPYDTVAVVAALRSPFFGISDEEIFLHHCAKRGLNFLRAASKGPGGEGGEAPVAQAFGILGELHRIRNGVSVEDLLRRLYEETGAPVTYLMKPSGEQRVANLLKIADTARALYERGVCTLRSFVTWLKERESQEAEEAEAITVETGDNFVRILTMHKAKGLEFPVTILTDLARVPKKRTERIIIDRVNSDIAVSLGKKESIRTVNFDGLKELEDRRSRAEELRLLYVSMTRARDFLVLPAYWTAASERSKKTGELRSGSMMKMLAGHIPGSGDAAGGSETADDSSDEARDVIPVRLLKGIIEFDTSSLDLEPKEPPALRLPVLVEKAARKAGKGGKARPAQTAQEEAREQSRNRLQAIWEKGRGLATPTGRIEFETGAEAGKGVGRPPGAGREVTDATVGAGGGPSGRRAPGAGDGAQFGALVHSLLEVVDWRKPGDLEAAAVHIAGDSGLPDEMAALAARTLSKALASDVLKRIMEAGEYYKEVPFAIKTEGTITEGKMDVVFKENDDIYVLDFKTDRVSSSETKARAEHYRPQAEAYARAVEAACGKPPAQVIFLFLHPMKIETALLAR